MAMFGTKSVMDMTPTEFSEWKLAIERQREHERQFRDGIASAISECRTRPDTSDREGMRHRICATLDAAHYALRCVDASDPDAPQTADTFARVTRAVDAIERMARDLGYRLSSNRGVVLPVS